MKTTKDTILTYLLTPLSWLYGGITTLRNWLFDKNILSQESYDVPIVSIGNITVGGTGKTPHVEYVVSMLSSMYNIAILSRGYKRKTKGFLIANSKSTPDQIGDEPLQMYQKFGSRVKVAVCESRRKGIRQLMEEYPQIQLIVLDDAFQHRWVKPKVSILLMDYNRPIYEDKLLPLGRLREDYHQINRADMVVVTKCPEDTAPIQFRIVQKALNLMSYQKLSFSTYTYGGLMPVFPDVSPYHVPIESLTERDSALLVTGIAHPRDFVRYFKKFPFKVKVMHFPDHHDFSKKDLLAIQNKFKNLKCKRKIIITTEKDAVRMSHNPYYPRELMPITFYMPIAVNMIDNMYSDDFISELIKKIDEQDEPTVNV